MSCIFCAIVNNDIPADKVYQDEYVVAFRDINPLATIHIVVVPKQCCLHFHNIKDDIFIHLMSAIKKIIKQENLETLGYRLVNNNGTHGGQTVNHVHFHLLGGNPLSHNLA